MSSVEYSTMPVAAAKRIGLRRSKPLKLGSSRAVRISRARSARKLTISDAVAVLGAGVTADHGRQDEFVAGIRRIGLIDRGQRVGSFQALGGDDGVIGPLHPFPPLVAVHRVVAAVDRAEGDAGQAFDILQEFRHLLAGAARRHVAAVEEAVDDHRHLGGAQRLRQGREMGLVAMDAAGGQQAQQMGRTAGLLQRGDEAVHRRIVVQLAFGEGLVDHRQVLEHDPAGAEIHVPDFGIADLAVGQTDILFRGVQESVGSCRPETIENGGVGLGHGVVSRVLAIAPAIENAENDGTGAFIIGHGGHSTIPVW